MSVWKYGIIKQLNLLSEIQLPVAAKDRKKTRVYRGIGPVLVSFLFCILLRIDKIHLNGEKEMKKMTQQRAPIYEALERFRRMRIVPFDVPGHKHGRGNPELVELLGNKCVGIDVNSMKPLDNLCHPVSVIKEAEELAADAFGAAHAFLMVGGTTSSVQSMVLSCCKKGIRLFSREMYTEVSLMHLFYVEPNQSM